jgi:hypothetical protein
MLESGDAAIQVVNISHVRPRVGLNPESRLIVNKILTVVWGRFTCGFVTLHGVPIRAGRVGRFVKPDQGVPAIQNEKMFSAVATAVRCHVQQEGPVFGSKKRLARRILGKRFRINGGIAARNHQLHRESNLRGAG